MQRDHSFWSEWACFLKKWGLNEVTAALLEGAAPVNLVLVQFLYMGHPLLHGIISPDRLNALTGMMEDQAESRSFAAYLREESSG
jgi:hypothetical protein